MPGGRGSPGGRINVTITDGALHMPVGGRSNLLTGRANRGGAISESPSARTPTPSLLRPR